MQFEEALHYMEGRLRFGWKLGNERMEQLCVQLEHPERQYPIIHIAGTKGKGSTTALCARILQEQGYRVGSYFSPYVYDVCERVQVGSVPIPHADFGRLVGFLRPFVDAFDETELGPVTEFELKTILAFQWFAEQKVDIAVIEVGLGGRLDATNVVQPLVTAITNIGLDHTQILGDTHALIAGEKAGIFKQGVPAFTAARNLEALEVITRIAQERNAPLCYVQEGEALCPTQDPTQIYWNSSSATLNPHLAPLNLATEKYLYSNLNVGLIGQYQRENAALAVALAEHAVEQLGGILSEEAVRKGLQEIELPGRFSTLTLPNGVLVVMDGAHNAMAAEALKGALEAVRDKNKISSIRLVMGMLTGHEPEGVLAALCPLATKLYACAPNWKRALPTEEFAKAAEPYLANIESFPSVASAVHAALREATSGEMIVITGSFYTVGEVSPSYITSWLSSLSKGIS
jgi:dihydrofolate synthase/folylpolyglutamate synthase